MNENIKQFLTKLASFSGKEVCPDIFDDSKDSIIDDYVGGHVDDAFELGILRGQWEVNAELAEEAKKLLEEFEQ